MTHKFAAQILQASIELSNNPVVKAFKLVGTAAYPEGVVEPKDADFLVLCKGEFVGMLEADDVECPRYAFGDGWDNGGSNALDDENDQWGSIRRGDVNLILTTDEDWYERCAKASDVCVALQLTEKFDRIVAYRVVRDGFAPELARADAQEVIDAYAEGEAQRRLAADAQMDLLS